MDFAGPFEVLSRLPNSRFHILWKDLSPVRDIHGLLLTPEQTFSEAPQLDVLIVPGGFGQQALMDDETVLSLIRAQAEHSHYLMPVCTGFDLRSSRSPARTPRHHALDRVSSA